VDLTGLQSSNPSRSAEARDWVGCRCFVSCTAHPDGIFIFCGGVVRLVWLCPMIRRMSLRRGDSQMHCQLVPFPSNPWKDNRPNATRQLHIGDAADQSPDSWESHPHLRQFDILSHLLSPVIQYGLVLYRDQTGLLRTQFCMRFQKPAPADVSRSPIPMHSWILGLRYSNQPPVTPA
jgi:hypothetical protein